MLVLSIVFSGICVAQTGRGFYNELFKAGGLDRAASEFACFADDPTNANFFIFSLSSTAEHYLQAHGKLEKLPKGERAALKRGFITIRGYAQGVAFDAEEFYDKVDASTWVSPISPGDGARYRVRLTLEPETLRYRRTVEARKNGSLEWRPTTQYGRCERVSPSVEQHAR